MFQDLKSMLTINVLLVLLLCASIIIFMITLKPILTNPQFSQGLGVLVYIFIIGLSIITAVTGIIIFVILSRDKIKK